MITVDRAELGLAPGPLALKLEQLQHSGSFKVRGAFANLLLRTIPPAGVVAASGGNHGAAVAYAARAVGVPAKIFVPEVSSPAKISRIRSYGADLVVGGASYDEARAASEDWAAASGALQVPAFDQEETILGAGSLALELREQLPETAAVLASVGGGGLLAGICAGYAGQAAIIGVEPAGAPTLTRALAAGAPVDAEVGSVAVDSLAPRRIGERTFAVLRDRGPRGGAGQRRGHRQRAGTALGPAPPGRRAGWLRGAGRRAVRPVHPRPGRPGRRRGQRGQHHRRRLQPLSGTAAGRVPGGVGTRPTARHPPRRQETAGGSGR